MAMTKTAEAKLEESPRYEIADIPVFDPWEHGTEIPFDENDTCDMDDIRPFVPHDDETRILGNKGPVRRFLIDKTVAGKTIRGLATISFDPIGGGKFQIRPWSNYRTGEPIQRIRKVVGLTKSPEEIIQENGGSVKIVSDGRGKFSGETLIGMGIFTELNEVFTLLSGVRGGGDKFSETNIPSAFFDLETGIVIEIGRLFVVPTYEDDKDRVTLGVVGQTSPAVNTGIKRPSALFLFDSPARLADFLSRKRIFEAGSEQPTASPSIKGMRRQIELLTIIARGATNLPPEMRERITSDKETIEFLGSLSDAQFETAKTVRRLMSNPTLDVPLKSAILAACIPHPEIPHRLDPMSSKNIFALAGFVAKWKPDGKKTLYQSLPPELRKWLDPFVKPDNNGDNDRFGMLEID